MLTIILFLLGKIDIYMSFIKEQSLSKIQLIMTDDFYHSPGGLDFRLRCLFKITTIINITMRNITIILDISISFKYFFVTFDFRTLTSSFCAKRTKVIVSFTRSRNQCIVLKKQINLAFE